MGPYGLEELWDSKTAEDPECQAEPLLNNAVLWHCILKLCPLTGNWFRVLWVSVPVTFLRDLKLTVTVMPIYPFAGSLLSIPDAFLGFRANLPVFCAHCHLFPLPFLLSDF